MTKIEKPQGTTTDGIGNVDQLRHAIDHGLAGDKVERSDPAAAPLGTDAEAGGVSPTPSEITLDAAATAGRSGEHARPMPGPIIYLGVVVLVIALVLGVISLAISGSGA